MGGGNGSKPCKLAAALVGDDHRFARRDEAIWREFPELVPGVMHVTGIRPDVDVEPLIAKYEAIARERLADTTESALPEIQAWRRAFSKMGLKPTQYRCASECSCRFIARRP